MSNKQNSENPKKKIKSATLRKKILGLLTNNTKKYLTLNQIKAQLEVGNNLDSFLHALKMLEDEGHISNTGNGKYKIKQTAIKEIYEGIVQKNKDHSAYIIIKAPKLDIYVAKENLNSALNKDKVKIESWTPAHKKKPEGLVLEVLERAQNFFAGVLIQENSTYKAILDNKHLPIVKIVKHQNNLDAKIGDKIWIKIIDWHKNNDELPTGIISTILGTAGDHDTEMNAILVKHGFTIDFSTSAKEEAQNINYQIDEAEISKRLDMRQQETFIIKVEETLSYTLSVEEKDNENLQIGVHIPDVTHYVKPGSIIDKIAFNRTASIQLVEKVLPMFPDPIVNNLNFSKDKESLSFSIILTFDKEQHITTVWKGKTIICPNVNLSEDEVINILESDDSNKQDSFDKLKSITNIAKVLKGNREKKGGTLSTSKKIKISLDEAKAPIKITTSDTKTNSLNLEEFTILVNNLIAQFIAQKIDFKAPFIYRTHSEPNQEKINQLISLFKVQNIAITSNTTEEFLQDVKNLKNSNQLSRKIKAAINKILPKAKYSTQNAGHHSLAFDHYTHFVSPLDRYSDVIAHRILGSALSDEIIYDNSMLLEIKCQVISSTALKIKKAQREAITYKQVEYLKLFGLDKEFDGILFNVNSKTIFIELVDSKYYGTINFDKPTNFYGIQNNNLINKKLGRIIEIGTILKVKVTHINLNTREVEMKIVPSINLTKKEEAQPLEILELGDNMKLKVEKILDTILVPETLKIQSQPTNMANQMWLDYEDGTKMLKQKDYQNAIAKFENLVLIDGWNDWSTKHLTNVLYCGYHLKSYENLVETVSIASKIETIDGLLAWNYACILARTEQRSIAIQYLKKWHKGLEDTSYKKNSGELHLILASLHFMMENEKAGFNYLTKLKKTNEVLLNKYFGTEYNKYETTIKGKSIRLIIENKDESTTNNINNLPLVVQANLKKILIPRKPARMPILSKFLNMGEMEKYSSALEHISEKDYNKALVNLETLIQLKPDVLYLQVAKAATKVFMNENEIGRNMFFKIIKSGHELNGTSWWNLACAQIRLNNFKEALEALEACSKTEYRSKTEVWAAISALGGKFDLEVYQSATNETKTFSTPSKSLTVDLPKDLKLKKTEILNRILTPRKVGRMYRPDIDRLSQKDKEKVSILLDTAYRATPVEASQMLQSIVNLYPDLYTLKIHLAQQLILTNSFKSAQTLLLQANSLRSLDPRSVINLAHIYAQYNQINSVVWVLEEFIEKIEKDYYLYLALAISRNLTGSGDAAIAAAKAIELSKSSPNKKLIVDVLNILEITPSSNLKIDSSYIEVAEKVLSKLQDQQFEEACDILVSNGNNVPYRIPEIGNQVLEPIFRSYLTKGLARNSNLSSRFSLGLSLYENQEYLEAADNFKMLYRNNKLLYAAVNASASFLKAGKPKRAKDIAGNAIRFIKRRRSFYSWLYPLVYNQTLAYLELEKILVAVDNIQKHTKRNPKLHVLLSAICMNHLDDPILRFLLSESLDMIQKTVYKPSTDLILSLVWSKLNLEVPDTKDIKELLTEIINPSYEKLVPAAEVKSISQIRIAYETLKANGEINKISNYMDIIIDSKGKERQSKISLDLSSQEIEYSISSEIIAMIYVVQVLNIQNKRIEAILKLAEIEILVTDNINFKADGFLFKHWQEIGKTAEEIGVPFAALRYYSKCLLIDNENLIIQANIKALREKFPVSLEETITIDCRDLEQIVKNKTDVKEKIAALEKIKINAPVLTEILHKLIVNKETTISNIQNYDVFDAISILATMELPDASNQLIDNILDWVFSNEGWEINHMPIDIDVYDEKIWPKEDNISEGTCLLVLSSRYNIDSLSIIDTTSEKEIWKGELKSGEVYYKRTIFFKEDGFSGNLPIDIPLQINIREKQRSKDINTLISTFVSEEKPVWPSYPTGSLSPEDVHGSELYGRTNLINQIIRSMGRHRSQATFFLQGPRQMGKTSLLNFVMNEAPNHILPVYINLEKDWSKNEPNNIWNYLVRRVTEESTGKAISSSIAGHDEASLINNVHDICEEFQKDYVLFLVDELHFLFEKCTPEQAKSILATFRDFLNRRTNKVSLLLSDRYTKNELERRCPSEYWAQLTILNVGPLDLESTRRAIERPTRSTNINFLPETISHLFYYTGGYPYHLQRAAQYILERMLNTGPWLTSIPEDVNSIVEQFIDQDTLFQDGLCRKDRIDDEIEEAISALLEREDLLKLINTLSSAEEVWEKSLKDWKPTPSSFLVHMPKPENVLNRLKTIGILNENKDDFFSPLLLEWLLKMRKKGLRLGNNQDNPWVLKSNKDIENITALQWQNLDKELIRRTTSKKMLPPLKEKSTSLDDWQVIVDRVSIKSDFFLFINYICKLIVEKREEKRSIPNFPWLFLTYHRLRLIRNFIVHDSNSTIAIGAWNDLCRRALGGNKNAYLPSTIEEWRALQIAVLQILHAGLSNALEIAAR